MFQRTETANSRNTSVGARTARAVLVCLLLVSCDRATTATERGSSHPAAPETVSSEGPTTASAETVIEVPSEGPVITETLDAAGITVDRMAGGEVRVHGQDRWGVEFDTTYADATYFANAAPVLARSLAEPQAEALVALVPRVQALEAEALAAP